MPMKSKVSISEFSSAKQTMQLHELSSFEVKNASSYPRIMQDSDIDAWR